MKNYCYICGFFIFFSGFLRDFNKKGTFRRVKCFVVGGPQLFASFLKIFSEFFARFQFLEIGLKTLLLKKKVYFCILKNVFQNEMFIKKGDFL